MTAKASVKAAEETLFEEGGIKVTTTRFVVHQKTYPISGLSSVAPYTADPKRVPFIVLALICAFVAYTCFNEKATGLGVVAALFAAAAAYVAYALKPTYALVVVTSGTEVQALVSKNAKLVRRVLKAVNEAIESRG